MGKSLKFINEPENITDETIDGYTGAYNDIFHKLDDKNILVSNYIKKGKVAILTGGGLAAEPLFLGYVGENMADCAVIGNINAAPSPFDIVQGTQAIDQSNGVLYIFNNYFGDVMSFDMAKELSADEGIIVEDICVYDNIGSIPVDRMTERKGSMGAIYVIKIAGGASTLVNDIVELKRIVEKARDNTRSLIVAGSSGHYIENGELMFDLPEDMIEYGVGFHGEPGIFREENKSVDYVVDKVASIIVNDLNLTEGEEVIAMVNSMGATSITELFIINNRLRSVMKEMSLNIYHNDVGNYYTSQDMIGFSITLMKLDSELKRYFDISANSYGYTL